MLAKYSFGIVFLGEGDSGWGAALCFTSGLNRISQKLFQTFRH